MDDFDFEPDMDFPEDEIVARHRNWPIYEDVGGKLYVTISGEEVYCTSIDDAHKEIDKAIKKWGKSRATR